MSADETRLPVLELDPMLRIFGYVKDKEWFDTVSKRGGIPYHRQLNRRVLLPICWSHGQSRRYSVATRPRWTLGGGWFCLADDQAGEGGRIIVSQGRE